MSIKSAVTISLVKEAEGGPFVFWHNLAAACAKAAELGYDAVEVFAPNADAIPVDELRQLTQQYNLKVAAVGTGGGWVIHKWHLCQPDATSRNNAKNFIRSIIDAGAQLGARRVRIQRLRDVRERRPRRRAAARPRVRVGAARWTLLSMWRAASVRRRGTAAAARPLGLRLALAHALALLRHLHAVLAAVLLGVGGVVAAAELGQHRDALPLQRRRAARVLAEGQVGLVLDQQPAPPPRPRAPPPPPSRRR